MPALSSIELHQCAMRRLVGVQFYCNFTGEDLLLRLAVQLEQARPEWFGARPGVHVAA
jgi:hypothetical protein